MNPNKVFAEHLRKSTVKNDKGVVLVSDELWDCILDRIENSIYLGGEIPTHSEEVLEKIEELRSELFKSIGLSPEFFDK